ncbi:hypothetical protein ACGFIF_06110 [Kribbella sp. NPDC049174]|uniref:hypothetical protein n=1 Tax=Kribbella sp. NPDC049174 TaxID=3364112 RepID=UPI0037173DB9
MPPDSRSDSGNRERTDSNRLPTTLRLAGADLQRGRNLDLYVVFIVAVAMAVLGVFNVVDAGVIGAATLAVLAVMASSALTSRHQVDEVKAALDRLASGETGNVPAERFLSPRLPALDSEAATAVDIGLVGITLTRTVRDLLPVLDQRLREGATVRVILIDVDSDAQTEAVARSKKASSPDFYRHRLSSTIDLLRILASSARNEGALELRVLPFVPTFGMCLLDARQRHGRIHVEVYQHRTIEANPSFSLRADRDGRWFGLFAGQFETLWESARTFPLRAAVDEGE